MAGLVTGGDLIAQLKGKELGDALLIPEVMLRHEQDVFLDDISVEEVERELGVPVRIVANEGQSLLDAVLGGERHGKTNRCRGGSSKCGQVYAVQ